MRFLIALLQSVSRDIQIWDIVLILSFRFIFSRLPRIYIFAAEEDLIRIKIKIYSHVKLYQIRTDVLF